MKPNQVRGVLKQAYYQVDKQVDAEPKVCSKGCFHCCYQPVEIMAIEKAMLSEYIKENFTQEDRKALAERTVEWLTYFDANTPDNKTLSPKEAFGDFREASANIPMPCPLLDRGNGACSVYKARPLTCRCHYVNDSPALCEADKLRKGLSDNKKLSVAHHLSRQIDAPIEIIPLTYALADILNIAYPKKPIERVFL